MMTSRLFKILTILAVTALVAGCKLLVVSPPGGDITSLSTTRNCAGGSVCEFPITDGFSESFTAVPKPGYQFVRWEKGTDLNCGDSTNPTCTVALTGNAAVDAAAIATFEIIHIMPIYKDVGIDTDGDGQLDRVDTDDDNDGVIDTQDNCPLVGPNLDGFGCSGTGTAITGVDIMLVGAREWAQADLFLGFGWNDANAVCPGGPCLQGASINGHDLTGWTWASREDANALYNRYIGRNALITSEQIRERGAVWAAAFFAAGWRSASSEPGVLEFLAFTRYIEGGTWAPLHGMISDYKPVPDGYSYAGTFANVGLDGRNGVGLLFYRDLP